MYTNYNTLFIINNYGFTDILKLILKLNSTRRYEWISKTATKYTSRVDVSTGMYHEGKSYGSVTDFGKRTDCNDGFRDNWDSYVYYSLYYLFRFKKKNSFYLLKNLNNL